MTSTQVVTEVERNLANKLPHKLPELRLILSRCLLIVPDPEPAALIPCKGQADPKDLPILVAAVQQGCCFLLSFNTRHYMPATDEITIQRLGDFLTIVRTLLARLTTEREE